MTYRVVVTAHARAEAREALRWLAERSPAAAARWYAGLERALASLAKDPERQPIDEEASELLGLVVRQKLYGRRRGVYRILYAVEGEAVTILFIRHSARGPMATDGGE